MHFLLRLVKIRRNILCNAQETKHLQYKSMIIVVAAVVVVYRSRFVYCYLTRLNETDCVRGNDDTTNLTKASPRNE